jgi:hypothetical protein
MCVDPNVGVVRAQRLERYSTLQESRGMEGSKMVQRDGQERQPRLGSAFLRIATDWRTILVL